MINDMIMGREINKFKGKAIQYNWWECTSDNIYGKEPCIAKPIFPEGFFWKEVGQ